MGFISTVSHSALLAEQRLTSLDNVPDDSFIRSADYRINSDKIRLAAILDTLANICISQPHHEVLAVGLRYARNSGVQLAITGNSDVPTGTVNHLKRLWGILIQMSAAYSLQIRGTNEDASPKNVKFRNQKYLTDRLWQTCIVFSWGKICRRTESKLGQLRQINREGLGDDDEFSVLADDVEELQNLVAQGKPENPETWKELILCYRSLAQRTDEFLASGEVPMEFECRITNPNLKLERYLKKLTAPVQDIQVLILLAASPRCKKLFQCPFQVISLPGKSDKPPSL